MGVNQTDFNIKRPKQEIRDIFEKIGKTYKEGKFIGIYNKALEIDKSDNG